MNYCNECGWKGDNPDDLDGYQASAGEVYPSGNCPECECCTYWYPDERQCAFCGDRGYNIYADATFDRCKHCERFESTLRALEFYSQHVSESHVYDFTAFKLIITSQQD